jgi:formamidopyrimidine-DNA glycosylase
MPELPEAEVLKRGLQKAVVGRTITGVTVSKKEVINVPPSTYKAMVEGAKIIAARRAGKATLLDLDNGNTLVIHLALGGRVVLDDPANYEQSELPLVYALDDGSHLVATKFMLANIHVLPTDRLNQDSRLKGLGRDALADLPTVEELGAMLKGSRSAVKTFLMDQTILAGIGNMYANEILFAARLHPEAIAKSLSKGQVERLHAAIRDVLHQAIKQGGSSESPFTDVHGKAGKAHAKAKVMWREGERCYECGSTIKMIRQASRATYFCPKCQPAKGRR